MTAITAALAPFAEVVGGTCGTVPFNLTAGSSWTVLYSFTPTAPGPYSQVVTITADVGTATATLSGNGAAGAVDAVDLDAVSPMAALLLLLGLGLMAMRTMRHSRRVF